MSQQFHRASTGDTVTVPDVLAPKYEADPAWTAGEGSKKTTSSRKTAEKEHS